MAIVSLASSEYYQQADDDHDHYGVGYSYAKFSGPVSGPSHEVHVEDPYGHGHKVDYVAKPDYHFEYGVEDPKSQVSQNRKEYRNDDAVHGEYTVHQPDGKVRVVKYTADKHNGFQAEVLIDGKPLHEEELQILANEAARHTNHVQHEEPHYYEHEKSYNGNEESEEEDDEDDEEKRYF